MATVLEVAREIFPDLDDAALGYIIWNHTGYPSFWTGDPEECFRRQLENYRDSVPATDG